MQFFVLNLYNHRKYQHDDNTDKKKTIQTVISTYIVELSLVSVQRVVLPVFSLAVLVGDEAPSLFAAATGCQSFTWWDVSCPETVYTLVAQQQEHLHHRQGLAKHVNIKNCRKHVCRGSAVCRDVCCHLIMYTVHCIRYAYTFVVYIFLHYSGPSCQNSLPLCVNKYNATYYSKVMNKQFMSLQRHCYVLFCLKNLQ